MKVYKFHNPEHKNIKTLRSSLAFAYAYARPFSPAHKLLTTILMLMVALGLLRGTTRI